MFLAQALELVVKFTEDYGVTGPYKEAAGVVRRFMEGGTMPAAENRPLVLLLHPNGDIEIRGAMAKDIKIDDRRAG
ncbi:MAG: hypothetical protein V3W44_08425 [Dehalococcoidales bacterium]